MAKVTPFEQYTVLDTLTQVLCGVRPPTLLPTKLAASCVYALQVVAGTNYFFKVQVAEAEWVWLRVFLSLFGDEPKLV